MVSQLMHWDCWKGRDVENGRCVEVTIGDGTIQSVTPIPDDQRLPWISPGWIDLQVNGCGGYDLNRDSVSVEDVEGVTECLWSKGVALYLPTIITGSFERMQRAMSKVAEACRLNSAIGASIGGIHMEGPYLSPDDGPRGAHPVAHIRQPSIAEFELLQEAAEGRISVVTLAPEIAGAMNFIRYLADQGTIVSIGHSGASPAQIREAADHGASMSTHLGNGSHLLLPRHSNYVWEQLADDRLSAGLIADGHHLPPSVLKTMLRAKREKAFVVSDCVSFAGMPTGDYTSQIGDKVVLDDRGRISMKHNPEILAGSAATLDMQMNLLLNDMSMPINEAISLITKRPAETMGWAQYGKLVSGTIGNLTLFDFHKDVAKVKIVETVVRGNSVYSA